MIDELKYFHQSNKRDTGDEINVVKNGQSRKRLSSSGGTSDVEWCPAKKYNQGEMKPDTI